MSSTAAIGSNANQSLAGMRMLSQVMMEASEMQKSLAMKYMAFSVEQSVSAQQAKVAESVSDDILGSRVDISV